MVECDLAKVEVAGSTPVSRSIKLRVLCFPSQQRGFMLSGRFLARFLKWRGTQVVRERSAKPLCVGSIPTRASILFVDVLCSDSRYASFNSIAALGSDVSLRSVETCRYAPARRRFSILAKRCALHVIGQEAMAGMSGLSGSFFDFHGGRLGGQN